MKKFQCSYVAKDRPETMEVWAKDALEAVSAALTRLGDTPFKRMEVLDDHGILYFRQGPSRLAKAAANTHRYYPTPAAHRSAHVSV